MTVSVISGFSLGVLVVAFGITSRRNALIAVAISALFQGLGFIGTENNSVPVYALALITFVLRGFVDLRRGQIVADYSRGTLFVSRLSMVFFLWVVAVTVVSPLIFAGIPVFSPRLGLESQVMAPSELAWQVSNAAQLVYLALNLCFVWLAIFVAPSLRPQDCEKAVTWSFLVAASLLIGSRVSEQARALMQSIFYNYAYAPEIKTYQFEGMRSFIPFLEPSMAGMFIAAAGVAFYSKLFDQQRSAWAPAACFLLAIAVLLLIGSASALVAFSVGCAAALVFALGVSNHFGGFYRWLLVFLGSLVCATIVIFGSEAGERLLDLAYTEKLDTESFTVRSIANEHAMHVAEETWFLGAGLGSNRVSSMFMTLFSSVGVVGVGLFLLLFIYAPARAIAHGSFSAETLCSASYCLTLLVAGFIAVPDIGFPFIWIGLIWMLATSNQDRESGLPRIDYNEATPER